MGGTGNDVTLTVTSLSPVTLQGFDADMPGPLAVRGPATTTLSAPASGEPAEPASWLL